MKPLIFIHPLSPALKKLLEVLQENAEADNFEIFEIDAINEAHQLVPTIGQSLTIMSNPKKCAMFMQPIRKVIKKLNSKVILLSPKAIPPKTLAKFQKIGLTECIIEPVPPKTLHYKVNLLLRSIVDNELENEEEQGVKDFSKDTGVVDSKQTKKEKKDLDDSSETDQDDYGYKRKKSKKFDDIDVDYSEEKKNKNSYTEDDIETSWKGKTDQTSESELEDEEEKNKSSYSEEEIESYYKNKKDKKSGNDIIDDIQTNKSNYQEEDLIGKDIHKKNKTMEEDLDDIMTSKLTTHQDIELEDDNEEKSGEDDESIDAYMRGKLNKSQELDEDDEDLYSQKQKTQKELIEEEENKDIQIEDDTDELPERKKRANYEELEEEDKDYKKEDHESIIDLKTKKKKTQIEEDEEALSKDYKKESELIDDSEDLDDERGKVDEIDKYYRGGAAKKDLEIEEDEDEDGAKDILLDEDKEEDAERKNKRDVNELDLEDEESDLKQEHDELQGLDIEDKTNKDEDDLDEEDADFRQKKEDSSLELEDDHKEDDEEEEDEENNINHKKSNSFEELEDTDKPYIEKEEQEEQANYKRRESVNPFDFDEEKKKGVHQKADHISTHYSSKKSTRHDDDDWNIGDREKKSQQFDEYSKKSDDIELSFGSNKDLGEQTINYEQIKKEFLDATVEQTGKKSKKTGKKFVSSEKSDKEFTKKKYNLDDEDDTDQLDSQEDPEEEVEKPIFSSDPRGLDVAIQVLNIYYKGKFENDDIFSLISDVISDRFQGETSFILYDKNTDKYNLIFSQALHKASKNEKKSIIENFDTDIIQNNFSKWKDIAVPLWSDITFTQEQISFSYPFYEGIARMGLCTVTFNSGFDENKAKELEVILETTRGIFLNSYHAHSPDAVYKKVEKTSSNNKNKEKKKGGIFSFFNKKKAS